MSESTSGVRRASAPGRRRETGLVRSLVLLSAVAACSVGAQAQTPSGGIAAIAHYSGADRQTVLENGARKEGKLTVFSSTGDPAVSQVVAAFRAKYPYIEVSVPCCLNSPTDVTTRALAEFKSGRSSIGVIETFVSGINALRQLKGLTTFATPNARLQINDATDPAGYYVATRSNMRGLAINTKAIPPASAPKSWQELLDPKWRGRITIAGGEAATGLIAYLQDTQSKDYLERFAAQKPRVVHVTARALSEMLISGEVEISPTITRAHLAGAISKGAPVAFLPISPALSISTAVTLPAKSPSPHAAMLFIDFLTSPEGQQLYVSNGYESLSPAFMKSEDANLKYVFPESAPEYPRRSDELSDLVTRLFHSR
jgi:iron(III) transport system substrate-binding protein